MAPECHSPRKRVALVAGARVKRADTEYLEIPGPREDACPGMTAKNTRRTPGTPLSCGNRAERGLPLTFRGSSLWFAQPLGSPSGQMRNKITKLLIVVVPRRTAGDG